MKKLYVGGDIITMEKEGAEAVLVENGEISQVLDAANVEPFLSDESIEKVDLAEKTMLPGFIDPHGHFAMMGLFASLIDLTACDNFNEIVSTMKTALKERAENDDSPLIGFGYDHNFLQEATHPKKDVLNQVSENLPVFICHTSIHVGSTNDAGLQLMNVDETATDPSGGLIDRVSDSNEPSGYLEEAAWFPILELIFQHSQEELLSLMEYGQDIYLEQGITTVQDGATSTDYFELFKLLNDRDKLKVDVVAYPLLPENSDLIEENMSYHKKYKNKLKINGYKQLLDGSPQGRTAWMTEPYEGEASYSGYPWYKDNQVKSNILKAVDNDVQLLTHCNGDAASDQLLRNYKEVLEESTNPNKHHLRPVMIHCQTVRDDQLDVMNEIDMIPSIFIAHTYYWGDAHLKNLGDKRGRRVSPARSAFDKNLVVNFHQDAPVIKPNMIETIWCAVNRQTRSGKDIGLEQRVSVYEALQALTINAAYSYFEEDSKGSIKEGKLADFVILDKNPLKEEEMNLNNIKVLETIKEGESMYKRV